MICYHCSNFPPRWASHHIWAFLHTTLANFHIVNLLEFVLEPLHLGKGVVLQKTKGGGHAVEAMLQCERLVWFLYMLCRGIPERRKLWETFPDPPAVLLYVKCFSFLSVCCGFGLGQLYSSYCFPAFPLPLPKGGRSMQNMGKNVRLL